VTFRDTKNRETRTVAVKGRALEVLQDRAKVRQLHGQRVFQGKGARQLETKRAWLTAVRRAGLTDFRFHDLRHSAASYLAMSGATLPEIGAVLGHKTPQMVQRYAHIAESHTAQVLDRMTARFLEGVWGEMAPTFDMGGWPNVVTAVPGFRILSTMAYPCNPALREEFHATLATRKYAVLKDVQEAWNRRPSEEEMSALLLARDQGAAADDVFRRAQNAGCLGSIAGEILLLTRQFAEHHKTQRYGVNKACAVLAAAVKTEKAQKKRVLTGGRVPIDFTLAKKLHEKAWLPYRSVSHLWAAHNLYRNCFTSTASSEIFWYESQDSQPFPLFLAIAEDFRQWGEECIPHGQKKPLFAPDEMWCTPAILNLPDPRIVIPPVLVPWYCQALKLS
jgi:Phage integrase family